MIERGLAVALAMLLATTSCTSTEKAATDEPPVAGVPPPGLSFDYTLDHGANTPVMKRCVVRFGRVQGGTTVEATLRPEANKILVRVPAGVYKVLSATCDNGRHFVVESLGPIAVAAGGVTYLGELQLVQSLVAKGKEVDSLTLNNEASAKNRDSFAELQARGLKVTWYKKPPGK